MKRIEMGFNDLAVAFYAISYFFFTVQRCVNTAVSLCSQALVHESLYACIYLSLLFNTRAVQTFPLRNILFYTKAMEGSPRITACLCSS